MAAPLSCGHFFMGPMIIAKNERGSAHGPQRRQRVADFGLNRIHGQQT
jgi:hypothetical protein